MLLSQCSFGPSAAQKAEAGRIGRAIDALRAAPNSAKRELFGALASASCETPELCQLKRICVAGFTVHLRALRETAHAKALLAEPSAQTEAAKALDTARAQLTEAARELAQCADAQGATIRKYRP